MNIVDWEKSRLSLEHPFIPVVIDLVGESDDVTFFEAQLSFIFRIKVI